MKTKPFVWAILVIIIAASFIYRVITHEGAAVTKSINTRTITDMRGRNVDIADPLERIALLGGPTGQIAFILGVQDKLCAVTNTLRMSTLAREVYPKVTSLPGPRTTAGQINIEELIQSDPQIVIATDIDAEIVTNKTRLPVAFLDDSMGEGIEDIKKEIRFYAYVFNTMDRADNYILHLEKMQALVLRNEPWIFQRNREKKYFRDTAPATWLPWAEILSCRSASKLPDVKMQPAASPPSEKGPGFTRALARCPWSR